MFKNYYPAVLMLTFFLPMAASEERNPFANCELVRKTREDPTTDMDSGYTYYATAYVVSWPNGATEITSLVESSHADKQPCKSYQGYSLSTTHQAAVESPEERFAELDREWHRRKQARRDFILLNH